MGLHLVTGREDVRAAVLEVLPPAVTLTTWEPGDDLDFHPDEVLLLGVDVQGIHWRHRGQSFDRTANCVYVGTHADLDNAGVWHEAVQVGASHVMFLPDAHSWLRAMFIEEGARLTA